MTARLFLFDDAQARRWAPFSATRPVGELLHGCLTQRERWEKIAGARCAGHLGVELDGFEEEGAALPVSLETLGEDAPRWFVSSRAVPAALTRLPEPEGHAALLVGGEVAGWYAPAGAPAPGRASLDDPGSAEASGGTVQVDGTVLGWPWELVERNPARILADAAQLPAHGGAFLLTDVHLLGDRPISMGHDVHVEPGVVLDARAGSIRLEDGVRVRSPARLGGPLWIGAGTEVLGGEIQRSSIGPRCKVRGEIQDSLILGYSNKAHDGYLGHAYVGRWVNLGAFTTNSDLKNSYSSVKVILTADATMDTGLLKVGCFLGDHVKTGIGTLLGTGAMVGAGSNLFGGGTMPPYVPPFSWGGASGLTTYRLDKFLEVAEAAMGRRNVSLVEGMAKLLGRAWEASRSEREGSSGR